eukprot:m.62828 g.62828  ORF g.62828 m.62828 type:complete len:70 (+) comp8044_c0_seq2:1521-1730(+)
MELSFSSTSFLACWLNGGSTTAFPTCSSSFFFLLNLNLFICYFFEIKRQSKKVWLIDRYYFEKKFSDLI